MPNRVNQLLLKDYTNRFKGVESLVSIGYEGMTVADQVKMRDELAAKEISLTFVKNRIANIAFKELELPEVKSICCNQTAFACGEDPVAIARFMVDFAKANDTLKLHGAMVEGTILDEAGVKDLAKSPTKDELKAQIVGQALGPGSQLAGALMGPASTIAGQLKTRIDELEKESA